MTRNIHCLPILALLVFIFACTEDGPQKGVSPSGFPYTFYEKVDSPTIQEGQYAYYKLTQRVDDQVVNAQQYSGKTFTMKLPKIRVNSTKPNILAEGLSLMSKGDSLSIAISVEQIKKLSGMIPPSYEGREFQYYDIRLVDIVSEEDQKQIDAQKRFDAKQAIKRIKAREVSTHLLVDKTIIDFESGKIKNKVTTLPSGLKYIIHEAGKGKKVDSLDLVKIHFYGMDKDKNMFNNSFQYGQPYIFKISSETTIEGWLEAILRFKKGTKATLFIPAELGFQGQAGMPANIPKNEPITTYIEIL